MSEKIFINNREIANYIMFKLDKIENGFTEEELSLIDEITINYEESDGTNLPIKDIAFLKKLQSISILNGFIYNADFKIFLNLPNLTELYFEKCEFENADLLISLKLKNLSLVNCNINNYLFVNAIENLEELSIINGNIGMSKLNNLKKLLFLNLSYSKVTDSDLKIESLKELHIDNTNVTNLAFIESLPNINKLIIDEMQYKVNSILINKLASRDLKVYDENYSQFDGDKNEL